MTLRERLARWLCPRLARQADKWRRENRALPRELRDRISRRRAEEAARRISAETLAWAGEMARQIEAVRRHEGTMH